MVTKSKVHKLILSLFAVVLCAISTRSDSQPVARLFIRYEEGVSYNRINETVVSLHHSMSGEVRAAIAIRVCSQEPIAFALATAAADPFLIADFLHGYGYSSDRVIFLRSEDCMSTNQLVPATEIWVIPEGASLPSHSEAITSSQIRLSPLGRMSTSRGMRDYKAALSKLVQNLRTNPSSVGLVVGYFLKKPSPTLRQRMDDVTRALEQSGLPRERYLVRLTYWPDEFSVYPPDPEPQYPNISVIELSKGSN